MDTRVDLYSLLMTTNAKFNKRLFSALHKSGLSHGQPKVLDYLGSHDGSPQKDIAIGCMIEPATVTSLISKMVSDGLVERRHLDSDRRTSYVYLTEKGHIMQKRVSHVMKNLEIKAFSGFGEDVQSLFIEMLKAVYENLSEVIDYDE